MPLVHSVFYKCLLISFYSAAACLDSVTISSLYVVDYLYSLSLQMLKHMTNTMTSKIVSFDFDYRLNLLLFHSISTK